jgi:hypothetical protein
MNDEDGSAVEDRSKRGLNGSLRSEKEEEEEEEEEELLRDCQIKGLLTIILCQSAQCDVAFS